MHSIWLFFAIFVATSKASFHLTISFRDFSCVGNDWNGSPRRNDMVGWRDGAKRWNVNQTVLGHMVALWLGETYSLFWSLTLEDHEKWWRRVLKARILPLCPSGPGGVKFVRDLEIELFLIAVSIQIFTWYAIEFESALFSYLERNWRKRPYCE